MKPTRRGFLSFLAALPFVPALLNAEPEPRFGVTGGNVLPPEPIFVPEPEIWFDVETGVLLNTYEFGATLADVGHRVWTGPDGLTLEMQDYPPIGHVTSVSKDFTSVLLTTRAPSLAQALRA